MCCQFYAFYYYNNKIIIQLYALKMRYAENDFLNFFRYRIVPLPRAD